MLAEPGSTYPDPVEHCNTCGFAARCAAQRKQDDHLSQVARMRSGQVLALKSVGHRHHDRARPGFRRRRASGAHEPDHVPRPARAGGAAAHGSTSPTVSPRHELLDAWEVGRGLCALPSPSPGDLFFDMEGDGLARDVPLEYLFGAVDMHGVYRAWWGHDDAGERRAFEGFVDFAIAQLERHPDMHIYHYAAYEKTALRRLMSRHGTREEEVDRLLRNEVLVDLYRVVRQGVRLSTDSYSLKKVERLYMPAREELIADAAGSMVMYERWLNSRGDGGDGDAALLDEIAIYNERDCVSTAQLRDWLEARRVEEERLRGAPIERPAVIERDVERSASAQRSPRPRRSRPHWSTTSPRTRTCRPTPNAARWLLAPLLSYHRRENKVNWWRHYDQLAMSPEELERDTYALGPLEMIGAHEEGRRTIERYRFEPQEHRIGRRRHSARSRSRRALGTRRRGGDRARTRRAEQSRCRALPVRQSAEPSAF